MPARPMPNSTKPASERRRDGADRRKSAPDPAISASANSRFAGGRRAANTLSEMKPYSRQPAMPASVLEREQRARLDQRIAARLLEIEHAPAVDRIARDVHRALESARTQTAGIFSIEKLQCEYARAVAAPARARSDRSSSHPQRAGRACAADPASADRSRSATTMQMRPGAQKPARHPSQRDEGGDDEERESFTHRVRRAPDAVEAPALAVAEPVGQATTPAGAPKPWNQPLSAQSVDASASTVEKPMPMLISADIEHAGREEDLDVRVIGEKSVDQLAERIGVEEGGADEAKLGRARRCRRRSAAS